MASNLVFYTNPVSRGRIVRWMLEEIWEEIGDEIGEPYETVLVDYGAAMKSPEYLAVNPMGKVPAVRHGDRVITETAAVLSYLADAFPQSGLAPPPAERADYYRWMFFCAGPVETVVTLRSLNFETPKDKRATVGYGTYEDVMNALESAVTGVEYVAEGRFSAADVYVGSQLNWGLRFGTIEARPSFEEYCARLRKRPAYERAMEIDDALLDPD